MRVIVEDQRGAVFESRNVASPIVRRVSNTIPMDAVVITRGGARRHSRSFTISFAFPFVNLPA